MKSIRIKAPAKINIGLNIISKREDGFHNLVTFFYPIKDLYDEITIEKSESFNLHTNEDNLPIDESNLIVKTVRLVEAQFHLKINTKIKLKKNIPMGAGLGGGSSDAAAVLISLNDMFKINLSSKELLDLSLQLGSDVPFFIKANPAIGESRGEKLTFFDVDINNPILIINPGIHISTSEAFQNIIPLENMQDYSQIGKWIKNNLEKLNQNVVNDFEKYVFKKYPEIKNIKEIMYKEGAVFSLMSGSGSTVFGIFNSETEAENVKQKLPKNYFSFISHPE